MKQGLSVVPSEVYGDAPAAAQPNQVGSAPPRARFIDAHDIGAVVGQDLSRHRTRLAARHVDEFQVTEICHRPSFSVATNASLASRRLASRWTNRPVFIMKRGVTGPCSSSFDFPQDERTSGKYRTQGVRNMA